MKTCAYCLIDIPENRIGRSPEFCCNAHKQAQHRLSKPGPHLAGLLNRKNIRLKVLDDHYYLKFDRRLINDHKITPYCW